MLLAGHSYITPLIIKFRGRIKCACAICGGALALALVTWSTTCSLRESCRGKAESACILLTDFVGSLTVYMSGLM